MAEVMSLREYRNTYAKANSLLLEMDRQRPGPLTASTPRSSASRQQTISAHKSRFNH